MWLCIFICVVLQTKAQEDKDMFRILSSKAHALKKKSY